MKRSRRDIRNTSFRAGFKSMPAKKPKPIRVPGLHPRAAARWQPALTLFAVRVVTGLRTRQAVVRAVRAGALPQPRFDRWSGRPYWLRLEFEAHEWWRRAIEVRHPRALSQQTDNQKLAELLGVPVIEK
jgi:hypothetical protein